MRYTFMIIMILLTYVGSSATCQQYITQQQAQSSVRVFETDPTLVLNSVFLDSDICGVVYKFQSTANTRNFWKVDAITGEVVDAFYGNRLPISESDTPTGPYTQTQCRQIATNFITSAYVDFSSMGFQIYDEQWDSIGWGFTWRQRITYDAWTDNAVGITISAETGQVLSYLSKRVPTPIAIQPVVTSNSAISIAQQATGITTITTIDGPVLSTDSNGVFWEMAIDGTGNQGQKIACDVKINAVSGDIAETEPYLVSTSHSRSIKLPESKKSTSKKSIKPNQKSVASKAEIKSAETVNIPINSKQKRSLTKASTVKKVPKTHLRELF